MSRILVTYFSRTGYTRRAAEQLALMLDANLAPIEETGSRKGVLGYLRSAWEALRGHEVPVTTPEANLARYDLVLIGTPVWASHASSPARSFARRHGAQLRRVGLFCTLGGSGADAALAELAQALGQEPIATLALTDRVLDNHTAGQALEHFTAALQSELAELARIEAWKKAA